VCWREEASLEDLDVNGRKADCKEVRVFVEWIDVAGDMKQIISLQTVCCLRGILKGI
jgi:hypothetical protein